MRDERELHSGFNRCGFTKAHVTAPFIRTAPPQGASWGPVPCWKFQQPHHLAGELTTGRVLPEPWTGMRDLCLASLCPPKSVEILTP